MVIGNPGAPGVVAQETLARKHALEPVDRPNLEGLRAALQMMRLQMRPSCAQSVRLVMRPIKKLKKTLS